MTPIGRKKALFIAHKLYVDFVYNMAHYEGNPFTYPDVKTTLEGITVGGHKISDQEQVLRIASGWQALINQVKDNRFMVDQENFIHFNMLIANNEALEVGTFRSGNVRIGGTDYKPPQAGDELQKAFEIMMENYYQESNPQKKGFGLFLDAARAQYFYDGNKRTAQLMMNGYFMDNGYPPVSLRPDVARIYNHKMIAFYETGDKAAMYDFLSEQQEKLAEEFKEMTISSKGANIYHKKLKQEYSLSP